MAHPYPLLFPNEEQRMKLSSYSSLANALGTDPGFPSRQEQRPLPMNHNAVVHNQAIYLDTPRVSNASYPYPARNDFNPGTYPARTPLPAPNRRHQRHASVTWDETSNQNNLHRSLPRYDLLPRPLFVDPEYASGYQARAEFHTIHFQQQGDKKPYSLWELLTMDTMPNLVAGNLPIFFQGPHRLIKIKLIWPGYSRYPFEKRIPIKRSTPLTPSLLLMTLAYHVQEFVRCMQNQRAIVESGQEYWTITGMPEGAPAMWKNCVITSLRHRTGSIWQPEIYYPRE